MENNYPIYKILSASIIILSTMGILLTLPDFSDDYEYAETPFTPLILFTCFLVIGILSWYFWKYLKWLWIAGLIFACVNISTAVYQDLIFRLNPDHNSYNLNRSIAHGINLISTIIGFTSGILLLLNRSITLDQQNDNIISYNRLENGFPIYKLLVGTVTVIIVLEFISLGFAKSINITGYLIGIGSIAFGILSWRFWRILRWFWGIGVLLIGISAIFNMLRLDTSDTIELFKNIIELSVIIVCIVSLQLFIFNKNLFTDNRQKLELMNDDILDQI